jgi:hypothetical protein
VTNRPHLPNPTAIAVCPSLAHAATIDPRSGNTVRSLSEFPARSRLFIKDDEQKYGEGNRYDSSNRYRAAPLVNTCEDILLRADLRRAFRQLAAGCCNLEERRVLPQAPPHAGTRIRKLHFSNSKSLRKNDQCFRGFQRRKVNGVF